MKNLVEPVYQDAIQGRIRDQVVVFPSPMSLAMQSLDQIPVG